MSDMYILQLEELLFLGNCIVFSCVLAVFIMKIVTVNGSNSAARTDSESGKIPAWLHQKLNKLQNQEAYIYYVYRHRINLPTLVSSSFVMKTVDDGKSRRVPRSRSSATFTLDNVLMIANPWQRNSFGNDFLTPPYRKISDVAVEQKDWSSGTTPFRVSNVTSQPPYHIFRKPRRNVRFKFFPNE